VSDLTFKETREEPEKSQISLTNNGRKKNRKTMFRNLGGKSFWNHLSLESEELDCFQGFPTSPVHILKPLYDL